MLARNMIRLGILSRRHSLWGAVSRAGTFSTATIPSSPGNPFQRAAHRSPAQRSSPDDLAALIGIGMSPRTLKILAAVLLAGSLATDALALEVAYRYRESRVEAAFLFNLAKFVTWPESAFGDSHSPLVLAVLDPQRYAEAGEMIAGRSVGGRVLEVRRVSSAEEALAAHLLLIGIAEAPRLDSLLAAVAGRPILTVSNIDGFAARGGMVELFKQERKIRFGVQMAAVRKTGLGISSEVLRLASFVQDNGIGGRP